MATIARVSADDAVGSWECIRGSVVELGYVVDRAGRGSSSAGESARRTKVEGTAAPSVSEVYSTRWSDRATTRGVSYCHSARRRYSEGDCRGSTCDGGRCRVCGGL